MSVEASRLAEKGRRAIWGKGVVPFFHRLAGSVPLVVLAMGLALQLVNAPSALATYAEVTDSYPASQEVSANGTVLTAAQIPDGSYSITASTSSYMCVISDCTLVVEGGSMSATFTMSRAYTRLYLGTAQEAAAQTNAAGTDDSAYYAGAPAEGYVPHVYTLPVSALNAELTLATYAGGTGTCKWFTRTVVFNSSAQVEEAVQAGTSSAGEEDGGKGARAENENSAKNASGGTGSKSAAAGGSATGTGASSKGGSAGASSSSGAPAAAPGSGSTTGAGSSGADASTGTGGTTGARGADADSGGGASAAASRSAYRIVPVTGAAAGAAGSVDGEAGSEDDAGTAAYHAVLAALVAGIGGLALALAFAWRRAAKTRRGQR